MLKSSVCCEVNQVNEQKDHNRHDTVKSSSSNEV